MFAQPPRSFSNKENAPSAPLPSSLYSSTSAAATPSKPRINGIGRAPRTRLTHVKRYTSGAGGKAKPYHVSGKDRLKSKKKRYEARRASAAVSSQHKGVDSKQAEKVAKEGGRFGWMNVPMEMKVPFVEEIQPNDIPGREGESMDQILSTLVPALPKMYNLCRQFQPSPLHDPIRPTPAHAAFYPQYDPANPVSDSRYAAWGIAEMMRSNKYGSVEEVDAKLGKCGWAPDVAIRVWRKGDAGERPVGELAARSEVFFAQCSNWAEKARSGAPTPGLHRPGTHGGKLAKWEPELEAEEERLWKEEQPDDSSDEEDDHNRNEDEEEAEGGDEAMMMEADTSFDSNTSTLRPSSRASTLIDHSSSSPGDWEFIHPAGDLPSLRRLLVIHLTLPHPEHYPALHQHLHNLPGSPLFRYILGLPTGCDDARGWMKERYDCWEVERCMKRCLEVLEDVRELGCRERTYGEVAEAWRACTGTMRGWQVDGWEGWARKWQERARVAKEKGGGTASEGEWTSASDV